MARREYARLRVDVWDDDDFRALDPLAQWLYLHLLTHPSLSFCGVVDWRPKRIAAAARHLEASEVQDAMKELVVARFVVVDEDTEEALIRTFVRHDGLLASPNVTTAMAREFRAIASRHLRGVVVHELHRTRAAHPDLKGWPRAEELLTREAIDPYPDPPVNPSGNPSRNGSSDRSSDPSGNPADNDAEPFGEPMPHSLLPAVNSFLPPAGEGLPPTGSAGGDARAGVRPGASGRAREEPPPRCPRHREQPATGACGPCGDARREHERWTREREQARRDAGAVVGGVECVQHPGEPAGRCGPCAHDAVPMPAELRPHRRRAS